MDASRAGVAAALLAVVTVPFMALHPLEGHLHDAGDSLIPAQFHEVTLAVLLVVVGLSFVPLTLAVTSGLRCFRQGSAFRLVRSASEAEITEGGVPCTLVGIPGVHFFTAGAFRPRIYATTDAWTQLPPEVFRAAILHEREHKRRHDVLWRLALAALEAAFRPLPAGRRLADGIALEWELAADRAAIGAGAQREHLFEALVAASSRPPRAAGVALSGVGTMQRLEVLATQRASRRPNPRAHIGWYAAGLAVVPLALHLAFWVGAICL